MSKEFICIGVKEEKEMTTKEIKLEESRETPEVKRTHWLEEEDISICVYTNGDMAVLDWKLAKGLYLEKWSDKEQAHRKIISIDLSPETLGEYKINKHLIEIEKIFEKENLGKERKELTTEGSLRI